MVPCIDFANHASGDATIALYETDTDGNAVLLLREGQNLTPGLEITITYGDDKGACEMLFSYGFLEESMTFANELYLDLDIPPDDPLKTAKKHVSKAAPGFRIFNGNKTVGWEGSFVWLLCVNEEDGLEFKLILSNDGAKELRVFWNGNELTDVGSLEYLLQNDPRWEIFQLRAAVVLRDRIAQQLSALETNQIDCTNVPFASDEYAQRFQAATKLRGLEETLLLQAYEMFVQKVDQMTHSGRDTFTYSNCYPDQFQAVDTCDPAVPERGLPRR